MPTQSGDCSNGFGRFEWDDGQVYEGQWKDDRQHGQGRWTCPLDATNRVGMPTAKPATYFGDWENGKMSGHGRFEFWNDDIYEGGYADGKRHGEGVYIFGATGESHAAVFDRGQTVCKPGRSRTKNLGIRSPSTVFRLLSGKRSESTKEFFTGESPTAAAAAAAAAGGDGGGEAKS